jgi:hypothetical protein
MTDWTEADLNGFLPGEPITAAKALLWYENPIAIAEGADGAPKIAATALEGNKLQAFGATTNSWAGLSDLDAVKELFVTGLVSFSGAPQNFQIRFSSDNGSSWGSAQTVFAGISSERKRFELHFDLVTGAFSLGGFGANEISFENGTFTVPVGANAFQLRGQVSSDIGFYALAMITGGKV